MNMTNVEKKKPTGKVKVVEKKENQPITENLWKIEGLPSNYKFYPEGTEIKGRPLKVLDVKYLSSMNGENFNTIINDVVKRCITGIDFEDFIVSDKIYTIFWLRANTYKDSGYAVEFTCPKCKKESTYNFSLDCLDVISVKDNYSPDKEVELPVSKGTIKMRLQRVKDELFIDEFINKRETAIVKFDKDILNVANVTTINGKQWDLAKKYQYMIGLDPVDYSFIESYAKHIDIGISQILNVKCNKCGGSAPIGVTFSGDFFVPQHKFE